MSQDFSHAPANSTRTALVSGVGRGLGLATMRALSARGWKAVGICRDHEAAQNLQREIGRGSVLVCCDITSPMLERDIIDALDFAGISSIDWVINNAAISSSVAPLEDVVISDLRRLLEVNLISAIRIVRTCAPYLHNAPAPLVVNITSRMGSIKRTTDRVDPACSYAYRISKAALNMFTACMSVDPSLSGIAVLSIHPGSVRTSMGGQAAEMDTEEAAENLLRVIEIGGAAGSGLFLDQRGCSLDW